MSSKKSVVKDKENQLAHLAEVVTELDNIRAGRMVAQKKISMQLSKVKIGNVWAKWKIVRKEIQNITLKTKRREKTRKSIIYSAILRTGAIVSLGLYGIFFLLAYLQPKKWIGAIEILRHPLSIAVFIILIPNAFMIIDYFTRQRIKEDIINLDKGETRRIKQIIQDFIDIIAKEREKTKGLNLKRIRLRLFFKDYNNIEILKKPRFLRQYYLVVPKLDRK